VWGKVEGAPFGRKAGSQEKEKKDMERKMGSNKTRPSGPSHVATVLHACCGWESLGKTRKTLGESRVRKTRGLFDVQDPIENLIPRNNSLESIQKTIKTSF